MRILIAIDGSSHSRQALEFLFERSFPEGTVVRFVTAKSRNAGKGPSPEESSPDDLLSFSACRARERLPGVSIETAILEGPPREAILNDASLWNASLIVVGCRGTTGLQSVLLGSVSQGILERATCPVLVARETRPSARGNVIVAIDSSRSSASAVEWLARQSWVARYKIGVISVMEPLSPATVSSSADIQAASKALLNWQNEKLNLDLAAEQWARLLKQSHPGVDIFYGVLEGDPKQVILQAAQDCPAELVIMGSNGRNGLTKLFLGSVSQHVASHSTCSVEVIRGVDSVHYDRVCALVAQQNSLPAVLARRNSGEVSHGLVSSPGYPISLL